MREFIPDPNSTKPDRWDDVVAEIAEQGATQPEVTNPVLTKVLYTR